MCTITDKRNFKDNSTGAVYNALCNYELTMPLPVGFTKLTHFFTVSVWLKLHLTTNSSIANTPMLWTSRETKYQSQQVAVQQTVNLPIYFLWSICLDISVVIKEIVTPPVVRGHKPLNCLSGNICGDIEPPVNRRVTLPLICLRAVTLIWLACLHTNMHTLQKQPKVKNRRSYMCTNYHTCFINREI